MVFATIYEHASSAFTFTCTNCVAISEHLIKHRWRATRTFSLLLKGNIVLRQVIWLTPPNQH